MHLIVDADSICYKIAWTAESEDDLPERVDHFLSTRIMDVIDHDSISFHLTDSSDCFRNDITKNLPLEMQYKANRINMERPPLLPIIKSYLIDNYGAIIHSKIEADDACTILQVENTAVINDEETQYNSILVSIDKDLRQVTGLHFNYDKCQLDFVSYSDGLKWFFKQLLSGDRNDNVIGIGGIGPVKSNRIVEDHCNTYGVDVKSLWEMSVGVYKKHGRTEEDCLINARLLWMLRENNINTLWTPDIKIIKGYTKENEIVYY